jgi:outer membrane lipoprotein-sorting protein
MILVARKSAVCLLITISFATLAGGECPDIEKLRKSARKDGFISLEFKQFIHSDIFETVDSLTGMLFAGREGHFRLVTRNQAIVSNGILLWSYSVENKQVLVDSVAGMGAWDPLTLVYDPERIYQCNIQSRDKKDILFEMIAIDSMTIPQQFQLRVSSDKYEPKKLVYYDDNDSRIEVHINNFGRHANLPDSLFEFRPGPDVEVIEMP